MSSVTFTGPLNFYSAHSRKSVLAAASALNSSVNPFTLNSTNQVFRFSFSQETVLALASSSRNTWTPTGSCQYLHSPRIRFFPSGSKGGAAGCGHRIRKKGSRCANLTRIAFLIFVVISRKVSYFTKFSTCNSETLDYI